MSLKSLHILYEDRHVLVCVKPPGTATQSKNIRTPDMVSLLKNHIAESLSSENLCKDARTNRSCICRKGTPGAKYAKLNYHTVTENHRYFSLPSARHDTAPAELDIHLHTGRHHQIRIQLAHIGCPIIGDTKYNSKKPANSKWQELKLCSYCLEFTHPKTKKSMRFSLL